MEIWLRVAGIALSTTGALLLAWRAKKLIEGINDVQMIAEMNFLVIKDRLDGVPQQYPFTIGSDTFSNSFKPLSKILFLGGVTAILMGNLLVAASWCVN